MELMSYLFLKDSTSETVRGNYRRRKGPGSGAKCKKCLVLEECLKCGRNDLKHQAGMKNNQDDTLTI